MRNVFRTAKLAGGNIFGREIYKCKIGLRKEAEIYIGKIVGHLHC